MLDEGEGEGDAAGDKGLPPHVVGPGELGVRGSEKDLVGGEGGEAGRALKKRKGSGEGGEEAVVSGEEGAESSMSIAERLEALSAAIDEEAGRSGTSVAGAGGVLALAGAGVAGEGAGAVQPRAESLSTVLTQALQSGDESLLEQCLAVGEQGVIEATVERLPSAKVLQFLLRWARAADVSGIGLH